MADLNSLYGRGLQYPAKWNPATGGAGQAEGIDSVRASIQRLFDTAPGEDRFNPAYGVGLHAFVFETDSVTLRALIDTVVRDALAKHEPRIQSVVSLNVIPDDVDPSTLHIVLSVRLIKNPNVHNFVFPFVTQQQG